MFNFHVCWRYGIYLKRRVNIRKSGHLQFRLCSWLFSTKPAEDLGQYQWFVRKPVILATTYPTTVPLGNMSIHFLSSSIAVT